jgi:DNA polymerase III epsilon subunit family exonuclease
MFRIMTNLLNKPINEVVFTTFDVETTGLETYLGNRMCEIGLSKFCGSEELGAYSSLVNPKRSIPEDIIEIHGITDEMVKYAPGFEVIADKVLEFIQGTVLVAHNAEFDLGFIVKHLHRAKFTIPNNPVVDTLIIARDHFNFPNNCLETIAKSLEIGVEGNHRALKDAEITKGVFQHFLTKLKVETLKELLDLQGGSIPFPEIEEVIPSPLVAEAIETGRMLSIRYVSKRGKETERIIKPIEVDANKGTEYLIAFCHLQNDQRVFRMDRIKEIKIK